jgi:hypothetical protein
MLLNEIMPAWRLPEYRSVAGILGPWNDPHFESGLIQRCKEAWNKPIESLTNKELATLLQQRIAVDYILPTARDRLANSIDDGTEFYEGELQTAVNEAKAAS